MRVRFTPISALRMNLVEVWFRIVERGSAPSWTAVLPTASFGWTKPQRTSETDYWVLMTAYTSLIRTLGIEVNRANPTQP